MPTRCCSNALPSEVRSETSETMPPSQSSRDTHSARDSSYSTNISTYDLSNLPGNIHESPFAPRNSKREAEHSLRSQKKDKRSNGDSNSDAIHSQFRITRLDNLILRLREEEYLTWKEIAYQVQTGLGEAYSKPALQMRYDRSKKKALVEMFKKELRSTRSSNRGKLKSQIDTLKLVKQSANTGFEKQACLGSLLPTIFAAFLKKDIRFTFKDRNTTANHWKAFVEDSTGIEWDWWPLRPRTKTPKQPAMVSVEWKYADRLFHECISRIDAAVLLAALEQLLEHTSPNQDLPSEALTLFQRLFEGLSTVLAPPSSSHQNSKPSTSGISPSNASMRYSPRTKTERNHSNPKEESSLPSQDLGTSGMELGQKNLHLTSRWLLFGCPGRRQGLKLEKLCIRDQMKDVDLFVLLKKVHAKCHGTFKILFSPFRFQKCIFVKFSAYGNRILSADTEDLPDDYRYGAEYDYTPRPPAAKIPLISSNEFKLYLGACLGDCTGSLRSVFSHDCFDPPPQRRLIERIPKKKSPPGSYEETAFGIEADYVVSFLGVMIYYLVLVLLAFGFWAYWFVQHPGDLQNASVPLFTIVSITTMFWTALAMQNSLAYRKLHRQI